ncbi:unnamed protein product [Rhizophagus irregularis]|nr:unnamed protein product [Rhizophagus irregularis]
MSLLITRFGREKRSHFGAYVKCPFKEVIKGGGLPWLARRPQAQVSIKLIALKSTLGSDTSGRPVLRPHSLED